MWIEFDEDVRVVDLAPRLAQAGVFTPLHDFGYFASVEIGPRGRSLLWRIGEDVVDLCADALWLMAHPQDRAAIEMPLFR